MNRFKLFLIAGGELLEYPLTAESPDKAIEEGRRMRLALIHAGTRQFGVRVDSFDGETIYNFTQVIRKAAGSPIER